MRCRCACLQALRLGTFLNETKPLKFLHSAGEEGDKDEKEPLVLRLGNYLNGGKGETPSSAPLTRV